MRSPKMRVDAVQHPRNTLQFFYSTVPDLSAMIAIRRPALLLFTLIAAATAMAQQPQPVATPPAAPAQAQAPALTPDQQAALARQDEEMTAAAAQVRALVDGNRAGEIWDGASAVMKRVVPREEFVRQVALDRQRLGAVQSRGDATVTRTRFAAGGQVPEGLYISVALPTRFGKQQQPVRELVSFRLDEDRTWRVSGYSVR